VNKKGARAGRGVGGTVGVGGRGRVWEGLGLGVGEKGGTERRRLDGGGGGGGAEGRGGGAGDGGWVGGRGRVGWCIWGGRWESEKGGGSIRENHEV